jgi:DnaJ family protein B protein 4
MPISKLPGQKGNLVIKFDVVFPRQLNSSQKEQIRMLLQQ